MTIYQEMCRATHGRWLAARCPWCGEHVINEVVSRGVSEDGLRSASQHSELHRKLTAESGPSAPHN
jgi:hypothetical protein